MNTVQKAGALQVVIWLSGPTGAGKTSLARSLDKTGFSIVEEDIPQDLFRDFVAEPVAKCESLQRHLMQSRLIRWQNISGHSRIVFDRSIDEDIEVFCRMHRRTGLLTQTQFDSLADFGRNLQDQIPKPDLIVFVTASPVALLNRIQNANGPALIVDNLNDQISLYSEWLQTRIEQVMNIDTTRISERVMAEFFGGDKSC